MRESIDYHRCEERRGCNALDLTRANPLLIYQKGQYRADLLK